MTWQRIQEQLRTIGVTIPSNGASSFIPEAEITTNVISKGLPASDLSPLAPLPFALEKTANSARRPPVAEFSAAARASGVTFWERVSDGELVTRGLEHVAPELQKTLHSKWCDIRSALLPTSSTASADLLKQLAVDVVFVDDEQQATREIGRLCAATDTLGLDIETAPRPEFLSSLRPIAITKDGGLAKMQPSVDTSAALDPFRAEIRLLQVASEIDGRFTALVIDLRRVRLGSEALAPIWRQRLVGHNLSFDAKMLLANGIELDDAALVDTILMSGLVLRGVADKRREGTRRPSLKAAVYEAFGSELPKASQVSPWWRDRLTDEQVTYAALDAVFALKLADALQPRITALVRGRESLSRLCEAVVPVARMELAGITLDREGLATQARRWEEELISLKVEIAEIGIANPSSGPQVAVWLRSGLEHLDAETGSNWLTTWPRTESGALSTKAKHLKRLNGILPGAELLVRHSLLAQLRSNFGDKLLARISPHTGRLHGNFLIAAAKSGRFSSSNPNLQNIPKSEAMRSLFVPAPGKALVVADYSQLELRVMAAITKDRVMTEAYRNGLDLHAVTAAGMLGIEPEAFDAANLTHKEARQKAKAVNFGVIYGSGPSGLREFARDAYGVLMSLDEAQRVIDRFLATYPGVARWQREQADRSRRNRTASTVGGRIYRFAWEHNGEYARNLALNLPVQGTAAEIALEATIRIDRRLRSELADKAHLLLQIHDEFVVEVDDAAEAAATVKQVLEQEMMAAFATLLPEAPVIGLVDAHAGPNWAAAKR